MLPNGEKQLLGASLVFSRVERSDAGNYSIKQTFTRVKFSMHNFVRKQTLVRNLIILYNQKYHILLTCYLDMS